MANPSDSSVQNLLPVQAYFDAQGDFQTFIGQGKPFTATISPDQSGLHITDSTIDSSVIGGITPAAAHFTTATVATQPSGSTDVVNLLALQSYAAGISWKQPCVAATLTSITLSGLQDIDGHTVVAGDRVLVKNQGTASQNGIYLASASAWTRASDADTWSELICAITFIEYGTQAGGAWFCTAQEGGTIGVTANNWSQFTTSATYTAGTGLTLTGFQFSITNTGVPASTYGSATATPVFAVNAQGQITSVTNTTITPAIGNVTGLGAGVGTFLATPTSANLAAAVSDETGSGALVFATSPTLVTPALGTPASGNFSTGTFTWPTFNQDTTGTAAKATNLAGGATGSLPYQSGANATTFLSAGTDGQILSLASGVPAWINNTVGTVTSVSGTGTVSGISLSGTVTSSGNLTLGGSLDLSSPPAIGGTSANSITGTTITANTKFVGTYFDASSSAGGQLRNASGTAQAQWGAGGGNNFAIDVSTNLNGTNAQIDISPTGTGHVHINPSGSGSVQIAPTSAGTMDNLAIGGTTPLAGTFTDLRVNNTISLAGSTGTSGYVLTSNGASAPTWQALPSSGITITDDTSTNATRYLTFTSATTGSITGENVSSTKLQFNPSTGVLTATSFSGSGSSLTGIVTSNVAGTGISVSGATGAVTITNSGVTALTGTSNQITVSASTGSVTLSTPQSIGTASSVQFGSFGVGTAASGTSGEIRATNNITAYYSSDKKFKENVRQIDSATEKAIVIGGKYFDWTDEYIQSKGGADGYFIRKNDIGVIAQDVQKVLPEAVREREDGSLAVDYQKLVSLAFASIAELKAEIEQLKAK